MLELAQVQEQHLFKLSLTKQVLFKSLYRNYQPTGRLQILVFLQHQAQKILTEHLHLQFLVATTKIGQV